MTFGLNVTTQNLHSVQLFANTKRVNFRVFFLIFEVGLRSNWPSKPMKMTFLLFCVVIFNDTRFFSTYFAVHCCLVWCVGVPQSFFTVHNECDSNSRFLNTESRKTNSNREQFLAGGIRVIPRYFQVGLGLGEGLGFKISTPFDV